MSLQTYMIFTYNSLDSTVYLNQPPASNQCKEREIDRERDQFEMISDEVNCV